MKDQVFIFCLLYLFSCNYISAQNGFFPIEKGEHYYYKKAIFTGNEKVLFASSLTQYSHHLDVIANDGSHFSIRKPKAINAWAVPFYYSKKANNSIITGWVYPEIDSFSVIMTQYDLTMDTHEIIQKMTLPGVIGEVIPTKIERHNDQEYVILSLPKSWDVAHQVLMLRINESGIFHIQSISFRPSGVVSEGLFLLLHVVDFDILADNRIVMRGHRGTGIAIADFNLEIIDRRGGGFRDINGKIYWSDNEGFELEKMGKNEYWLFGLFPNVVIPRFDANMIVYHVEMDTIITDTIYFYNNQENLSRERGKSVKLKTLDAMICTYPYYGAIDWRTPIPSEIYFKRIQNREEIWHKKYESEYYIRVHDMILVDSCEVMIVGNIFDYFDNGYLQGFYATFDCDGNMITSNIDLKEVDLNLYPNPSDGLVTVEIEDWKNLDYSVYNIEGKLIHSGLLDGQDADLSHLTSGTYVLKITTPEGIVNQKVVISN